MGTLVLLGIIIAFLLAGFFAGVEVGFVSLNRLSVELRKKQKSKSAILLSGYLDELDTEIKTPLEILGEKFAEILRTNPPDAYAQGKNLLLKFHQYYQVLPILY